MSAPQWLYDSYMDWLNSSKRWRWGAYLHFLVGILLWLFGFWISATVMFVAGFIFMRLSLRALDLAEERMETIVAHAREELDRL